MRNENTNTWTSRKEIDILKLFVIFLHLSKNSWNKYRKI